MKTWTMVFGIIAIICSNAVFGGAREETLMQNQKKYRDALAFLMQKLEKKNNIRFAVHPPLVRFTTPKDPQHTLAGFTATYIAETNTILFHSLLALCDTESISRRATRKNPRGKRRHISVCETPGMLEEILCHELAHYYVDLLTERQFPRSWLMEAKRSGKKTLSVETQIGIPIVAEGIATYFGKSLGSDRNHYFNEERWNRKYQEQDILSDLSLRELLIYNGGHALVTPILDRYGAEGVAYLISHRLNIDVPDFSTVTAYQKQALHELSR